LQKIYHPWDLPREIFFSGLGFLVSQDICRKNASVVSPLPQVLKAVSKPILEVKCHSERSEESRISNKLRSFTSFRMTEEAGFEIACNT
jgi:hypothetical protein